MRTISLSSQPPFTAKVFAGKLHLLVPAILFCFWHSLTFAQAPVISYSSPQTYHTGTAVMLTPTVTGGAAQAYNAAITYGSGINNPFSIAADAAGNLYVVDFASRVIKEIPAGGGAAVTIGSGFSQPYGVAADAAGNVYVADEGADLVKKIPAGNGAPVTIGTGFSFAFGVAVDVAGNVYVTDANTNSVTKIPAGGGSTVSFGGFSNPTGIAVDAAGNVYVADYNHSRVAKIPAGGGPIVTVGSGFLQPVGVAVDAAGNLYVADAHDSVIKEVPAGGGAPVTLASGIGGLHCVAIDTRGNLYFGSNAANVQKLTPAGGYYISAGLPAGLSFNSNTGVISGTPTATSPAADYTITAYNSAGSATATVNIKVDIALPAISYSSPQTYVSGTAIAPLTPVNSGVAARGYNSTPAIIGSDFGGTWGIAADGGGNVYVADYGNSAVKKIPAGNGAPVSLGSGFNQPTGIAVDAAGNVYVADKANNAIKMIPAGNGVPVILGAGFNSPTGVAVDAAGNVYVADSGNNAIKKIPAGNGVPLTLASGFNGPYGLAVDAAGNVYVADTGNNAIKEIPAGGGAPITLGSGFNNPTAVAVDATGNVYVVDTGHLAVKEIPAPTGVGSAPVTIGSSFGFAFGVAVDAAGNVYVTGNEVKVFSINGGYYINPNLPAGLTFDGNTGVISGTPTLASPPTNYTVTAYNAVGSTSAGLTITVKSTDATLSNLTVSSGTLAPVFAAATTIYTAGVANATTSITVTPTTGDANATIKVNGVTVVSGTASAGLPLSVGTNTITTVVTAQDGVTTKTYTITVTRAPSADASLTTIGSSITPLSPAFTPGNTSYAINVPNATVSITVQPVTGDPNATMTVNNTPLISGAVSQPVALAEGNTTTISITVTAQDGTTKQTYTIVVTRAPSLNAGLTSIGPSATPLSPAFTPGNTSYTINVLNATASITVKPVTGDPNATMTVNNTPLNSGTVSPPVALAAGQTTIISIAVTAQNGTSKKTYNLSVTRALPSVANLSALQPGSGKLSPVFAAGTTVYTAAVPNVTSGITITPTTTDPNAVVTVNNTPATSGTAFGPIALAVGPTNVISIKVTAQDGSTTKTYTVTVTRGLSTNDNLGTLGSNISGLNPAFAQATTSYTLNVSASTSLMTIKPITSEPNAVMTINGTPATSGVTYGPIALAVGSNTIAVKVTAQDGVANKTYTVTVNRPPGAADGFNPGISVSKPAEAPALAEDGILVHQGISPNGDGINDVLQIDNISQYPENKLSIMNRNGQLVYEAKGFDNSSKTFDGHSNKNGQMQLPGTYFYQLEYNVNGVVKHKTGFIVLKY